MLKAGRILERGSMFKQYRIRDYDFKLIILVVMLALIGVAAVGSAKESLQSRQLMGVIFGVFLMLVISFFDYTIILKFYLLFYAVNLILLGLVFTPLGNNVGGATRWLNIFGFQFQPSESAKILLILFFAQFIMKHKEHLNTFKYITLCLVLICVPWIMIFKQPDLSTSVTLLMVFCVLIFVGGLSYKVILGVLAVLIPTAVIVISLVLQPDQQIIKPYQQQRIMAFINPQEYASTTAYQQLNSITAIASGQLNGKGYRTNEISSVKNGNYISEPQTDFIFAVIGEEFGFKGSCIVIILLFLIAFECISVARKAKDLAGTLIACGVGTLIAFQGFLNIGVATMILPNTGLPLPFVSYGLTSLLSLFMGIGFVLNVRLQCKK